MNSTNEKSSLWCAVGLAVTVLAGCSSVPAPDESSAAAQPASIAAPATNNLAKVEVSPVASEKPSAAATPASNNEEKMLDVSAITRLMTKNPRTLWHGDSGSYSYFVGTVVQADYRPDGGQFSVATAYRDGNNFACEYNLDGKLLKIEGRGEKPADGNESKCRDLADTLVTHLKPD